jgi:uncharacterized coiled-coil DUF342 family protein
MIIALEVDVKRLAKRLHISEEQCTALLNSSDDYVLSQLRKNTECFERINGDTLSDINTKEKFFRDWRIENEQSFSEIKNQITTMSKLLDSIKAADDSLHNEVVAVGNRVSASLTDLDTKISSMQATIAAGGTVSAEDTNEAAAIVAQAQADALALSNVDPAQAPVATEAQATTEAPAATN